jgi:hypothetical protein
LEAAFGRVNERVALLIPRPPEEVTVVLASLMSVSVRFHPLATTSPNTCSGLRVLCGRLDQPEVEAAAEAHGRAADQRPVGDMVDIYLADAAGAEAGLARGVWGAIDLVDRLRGWLMRILCDTHGGCANDSLLRGASAT